MTPFPSAESHAVRSPEILGDLTLWDAGVELGDRTGDVEERFLSDLVLPGVIVYAEGRVCGVLSRKRLFAALSRAFARELFIKRPCEVLLDFIDTDPLVLSIDTPIAIAVNRALARSSELSYEPVLVEREGRYLLLEVDVLMRVQSRLLLQAVDSKDALLQEVQNKADELSQTLVSLERARDRLLQSEQRLEGEVAKRTQELAMINADLLQKQAQIDSELKVARSLQQSILPSSFPIHDAYHGQAIMRAARMIGGDFYDVFRLDEHRLGVIVADVSGKGVPAALFMVLVRTMLQDLALQALSPAACIAEANRQLIARNPISLFVTTVYGILDARTGQFTFCNGGHIMPYVLRASGGVEVVDERSSPLVGLLEMAVYTDHTISLQPGDGLMLVTDGIAECFDRDGQLYGEERLLDLLASNTSMPVDRLLSKLLGELDQFSAGTQMSDDVTVLTLRYVGDRQAAAVSVHSGRDERPSHSVRASQSRFLR